MANFSLKNSACHQTKKIHHHLSFDILSEIVNWYDTLNYVPFQVDDVEEPVFSLEIFDTLDKRLLSSFFKPYHKERGRVIVSELENNENLERFAKNPSLSTSTSFPSSVTLSSSSKPFQASVLSNMNELHNFKLDMDDTESMMKLIAGSSAEFKQKFLTLLLRSDREGLLKLVRNMIAFHMKGEQSANFISTEMQSQKKTRKELHLPSLNFNELMDQLSQKQSIQLNSQRRNDDFSNINRQEMSRKKEPFINSAVLLHKQTFSEPARFSDTGSILPINEHNNGAKFLTSSVQLENRNSRRILQNTASPQVANNNNNNFPTPSQIQAIVDKNGGALDVLQLIEVLNGIRGTPMFDKIMNAIAMLVEAEQQSSSQFQNLPSIQPSERLQTNHGSESLVNSDIPRESSNQNLNAGFQSGLSAKSITDNESTLNKNVNIGNLETDFDFEKEMLSNLRKTDSSIAVENPVALNEKSSKDKEFQVAVFEGSALMNSMFNSESSKTGKQAAFSTTIADLISNESRIPQNNELSFPVTVDSKGFDLNANGQTSDINQGIFNQPPSNSNGVPLPNFSLFTEGAGQILVPLSSDIGGQLDPGEVSNFQPQSERQSIGDKNFREESEDPRAGAGNFVPLSTDFEGQFTGEPLPNFMLTQETIALQPDSADSGITLPAGIQQGTQGSSSLPTNEFGVPENDFALQSIGVPLPPDDPNAPPSANLAISNTQASVGFIASGVPLPVNPPVVGVPLSATGSNAQSANATDSILSSQTIGVSLSATSSDSQSASASEFDSKLRSQTSGVTLSATRPDIHSLDSFGAGQVFSSQNIGVPLSATGRGQTIGVPLPASEPSSQLAISSGFNSGFGDQAFGVPLSATVPNIQITDTFNFNSAINDQNIDEPLPISSHSISPDANLHGQSIGVPLRSSRINTQSTGISLTDTSDFNIAMSSINRHSDNLKLNGAHVASQVRNVFDDPEELIISTEGRNQNNETPLQSTFSHSSSNFQSGHSVGVPLPAIQSSNDELKSSAGPFLNVPVQVGFPPQQIPSQQGDNSFPSILNKESFQTSSQTEFNSANNFKFSDSVRVSPASLRNRFKLRSSNEINSLEDQPQFGSGQLSDRNIVGNTLHSLSGTVTSGVGSIGVPLPTSFQSNQDSFISEPIGVPLSAVSNIEGEEISISRNPVGVPLPIFSGDQFTSVGGLPLLSFTSREAANAVGSPSNIGVPLPTLPLGQDDNAAKSVPRPFSKETHSREDFLVSKESLESFNLNDARLRIKPAAKQPGINYDAVDEFGYDEAKRKEHKFVTFLTPGVLFPYSESSNELLGKQFGSHSSEGSDELVSPLRIPSYTYTG